ncbi:UNVERIFIED_CONTAM: putative pectinesterase/pectinesterase inhibitor 28 [Sesamum indicum]
MDESKKKITIVAVCSCLLVAMVVALIAVGLQDEDKEVQDVSSSKKAITSLCETTDYQEACVESLNASGTNSTNPKDLIDAIFQSAIDYIKEASKNSTVLLELQTDPRAKAALENCQELADRAVHDLERSFQSFNNFDITNMDDLLLELKIWLSGAITHQETCLDGFEGVPGEAGEKMRVSLTKAMQMTSNALAMMAELSTYIKSLGIESSTSRRLLSENEAVVGHDDELPNWMDLNKRRLLSASPQQIRPHLVVAKDGSGKFRTINEALKHIPKKRDEIFVLYIKEGVYEERVQVNSSLTHLLFIGDGPTKTRITGKLNFIDGTNTYRTATVAVQGDNFMAVNIGFENSAGPQKHQAVALRVSADKAIFYNCHMDGYQDTLYTHTYRQFYRDCVISGTIDFIFGDSAAVFQGCTLLVRKPLDNQQCIVTAQGRKDVRQPTGLVIQNCSIKADEAYYPLRKQIKSYLGRPWKQYSRTIIMESFLDDLIQPQGWLPWNETFALQTLFYTEFNNRGPAAPKSERVKWAGIRELPSNRIRRFTLEEFLDGHRWIPQTKVPHASGFIFEVPKEDPNVKYSPVVPEENKDLGSTSANNTAPSPSNQTSSETTSSTSSNSTSPLAPQSGTAAPSLSSRSYSPASISQSNTQESNTATSPQTSTSYSSANPPISPSGSSASSPHSHQTTFIPHITPSGSPALSPQSDFYMSNAAASSPGSPSASAIGVPTASPAASPGISSFLGSPSGLGSAPPLASLGGGSAPAPAASPAPMISPGSSAVSAPSSDITASPQSSYSSYASSPS